MDTKSMSAPARSGKLNRRLKILGGFLALALVFAIALPQFVYYIQSRTVFAEAKNVFFAAGVVMMEIKAGAGAVSDNDYMLGLTGTYENDPDNPWAAPRAKVSDRLNALLAPDIIFSKEPANDKAYVSFTVENAEITGMVYQTLKGGRIFTVAYKNGETNITHKKY
jgi:type II secretory pathway pseudopilin PulG